LASEINLFFVHVMVLTVKTLHGRYVAALRRKQESGKSTFSWFEKTCFRLSCTSAIVNTDSSQAFVRRKVNVSTVLLCLARTSRYRRKVNIATKHLHLLSFYVMVLGYNSVLIWHWVNIELTKYQSLTEQL